MPTLVRCHSVSENLDSGNDFCDGKFDNHSREMLLLVPEFIDWIYVWTFCCMWPVVYAVILYELHSQLNYQKSVCTISN